MKILNKEQIQKVLPHRPPMLLIDRMIDIDPGKRVVTIKDVTAEDEFFKGHFPGRPIMPGASIIEAMAQTAILLYHSAYKDVLKKMAEFYLGSVKAHFMHSVVPGDQLRLEVKAVKLLINGGFVTAQAFVGVKQVAEAELVLIVKQ